MLGLVTHIPNVFILREEVLLQRKKKHSSGFRDAIKLTDSFELIHISLLREYLEIEFSEVKDKIKFEYNSERIIDDFLFICFFIGNDFLPSLNTIDIDEGSLDKIFEIYKQSLPSMDDYITFHGKIDFKRAEVFFKGLSKIELDSLNSMLKKLEFKTKEIDENRKKTLEDKRKQLLKQKINTKKITKLKNDVCKMTADEKKDYKKKLVKKKLDKLKKEFDSEIINIGCSGKIFEEDIIKYHNGEPLFEVGVLGNKNKLSNNNNNDNSNFNKNKNNFNNNNINSDEGNTTTNEDQRNLTSLFDSDECESDFSSKKKFKGKLVKEKGIGGVSAQNNINIIDELKTDTETTLPKPSVNSALLNEPIEKKNIFQIMKHAVKYINYIKNEDYCSDININDLNNSDVSDISDIEENLQVNFNDGFNDELLKYQDYEKVFQQKLVSLYIKDVGAAKDFYYQEKLKFDMKSDKGAQMKKEMFQKYLEGLQWVLYYYYRGVQSWRWFYPYHYPPMISDFENMDSILEYDIDKSFERLRQDNYDGPLLPFQSLMMILPETSKVLLPKSYHDVYTLYSEYYPTKFVTDFNGKRMPWEALTILPFVNEDILRSHEVKKRNESLEYYKSISNESNPSNDTNNTNDVVYLTKEELERNTFGRNWSYKYNKNQRYIPNKKSLITFDFTDNHFNVERKPITISVDYKSDTTDSNDNFNTNFKYNIDYNYSKKSPCMIAPSLSDIKFQYFFNKQPDIPSKKGRRPFLGKKPKVLSISPSSIFDRMSEDHAKDILVKALQKEEVFINYPYKTNAKLIGVVFYDSYMYLTNNNTNNNSNSQDNSNINNNKLHVENYKFPSEMKNEVRTLFQRKGIYLEAINSHIFLEIVPFDRYVRTQNGNLLKMFHEKERIFTPVEISNLNTDSSCLTFNKILEYNQKKFSVYTNASSEFEKSDKAIILTKSNYGAVVKVDRIISNNKNNKNEYDKFNSLNYGDQYYDRKVNYDLTENDWKIDLNRLYDGDLVAVSLCSVEEPKKLLTVGKKKVVANQKNNNKEIQDTTVTNTENNALTDNNDTKENNEKTANDDNFFDSSNIATQQSKNEIVNKINNEEIIEFFKEQNTNTASANDQNTSDTNINNNSQQTTPYTFYKNYETIPIRSIKNILHKTEEFYISMDELAKKLNITNWTLSVVSSCVYIVDCGPDDDLNDESPISDMYHWNVGLNIKSNKGSKLILPGYTRYVSGEKNCFNWEFSTLAVQLIEEYYKKFRFVFDALEKKFDQYSLNKFFKVNELFDTEFDKNLLDNVIQWINSQEISGIGFCSTNSNFLNKRDIKKIEDFICNKLLIENEEEDNSSSKKKKEEVKKATKQPPQQYVVNPNYLIVEKLPHVERFSDLQIFHLGDRVVNIRSDDKRFIPFGLQGTITGVTDSFVEVLFDCAFFGGETCGGRLPFGKGKYVETVNLLNLTKKTSVFLRRNHQESFMPFNYKYCDNQIMSDHYEYPLNKNGNIEDLRHKSSHNDNRNDGYYNKNSHFKENIDGYGYANFKKAISDNRGSHNNTNNNNNYGNHGGQGSYNNYGKKFNNNNSNNNEGNNNFEKKKILINSNFSNNSTSNSNNNNNSSKPNTNSNSNCNNANKENVDSFFDNYSEAKNNSNSNNVTANDVNPNYNNNQGMNFSTKHDKSKNYNYKNNNNYKNNTNTNFSNTKNVSQYKKNRLFANENIKKHDVYYFTSDINKYKELKNTNPNVI